MRRAHLSKNGVVNHGSNYEVQLQSCCNLYPNSLLEIGTLPEERNTDPLFFSVEVFYVIDFPIYQHVGSILQCCYAISFTLRFFGLNHNQEKKNTSCCSYRRPLSYTEDGGCAKAISQFT